MKDSGVILVIRQRKYFLVARILRFFLSTPIVSELHEGGLPLKVSRSRKKSFQNLFRKVDGVVFTNASQIEYLKNLKYELPSNYVVLPNGVEVEKFAKASVGDGDAREVFMTYTGQFTSWKNVPLVFEILKYLPSHFKLRIAGGKVDGSNSESYIHGLEEEFDVKGRVDYVGFVHPDRIVDDALSGSSVLLVPLGEADVARYATSPMKLVEYMATPIPIVAVGHPSVLSLAGEDTVHLTTTDVDDFADAVLRAINEDVALRRERIRRANQRSAKYDHKNRAALYSSWLEDF